MYVLLGDSQSVRLQSRFHLENCTVVAESGASICRLQPRKYLRTILENYLDQHPRQYHSRDDLVVLAGTNDILADVSLRQLQREIECLVGVGLQFFRRVLLCKTLPIPRLHRSSRRNATLASWNNWLEEHFRRSRDRVSITDTHTPFIEPSTSRPLIEFFELHYHDGREDKIHLNDCGLFVLKCILGF